MIRSFFVNLIILIIIGQIVQIDSLKRKLVDFQVFEENQIYKSKLEVDSLIDLNFQLALTNETKDEDLYDAALEVRLPFPYKIAGKLRKLKLNSSEQSLNSKRIYKVNLAFNEQQHSIDLIVNHTIRGEIHEFTSELDYKSIESKLEGKYLGSLWSRKECPKLTLYHNFTANVDIVPNFISFSSNLTEECDKLNKSEKANEMKITIDFSTLINRLFNFKLDQLFVNGSKRGNELMKLVNMIYEIEVAGHYQYSDEKLDEAGDKLENSKYKFEKRATFKSSLPDQFPSFEIEYKNDDESDNKIKLSLNVKNSRLKTFRKEEL